MKKNEKKNIFTEFKDFITRGNVISLAVGIIIGDAFTNVINGFVDNIIMPAIGMILGKVELSQLKWVLSPETNSRPEVAIFYGKFIQAGLNFFVIALCVFFFCLLLGKNPEKIKTKDEAQKEQAQKTNELLEEIRDALNSNNNSNGNGDSKGKSNSNSDDDSDSKTE